MTTLICRILFWALMCVLTLVCAVNFAVMGIDYVMLYHGLNPVIAAPIVCISLVGFVASTYNFMEDFALLLESSEEPSEEQGE